MNSALKKFVIDHWLKPVAWKFLDRSLKGLTPCLFVAIMPCAAAKQDSRKVHECKEE
jgi:hypothetical protein